MTSSKKRNRGLGRGLSALMNDLSITEQEAPTEDGEARKAFSDLEKPLKTSDETISIASEQERQRQAEIAALEKQLIESRKDTTSDQASETAQRKGTVDIKRVTIDRLSRNPNQPRKVFDKTLMEDLVRSIEERGVLQPVLVRPLPDTDDGAADAYQIVAGERRWQAALKAKLSTIPVIIRNLSDQDVLEIGIIENVQRADLNPLEEALAYEQLINEFGRTQAEIAKTIGKSRAHVANTVRLLNLSERARSLLLSGDITAGHARAVLAADEPDALVEAIIEKGLSVRDAERWARGDQKKAAKSGAGRNQKTSDILSLEQSLQDKTGLRVDIQHRGKGGEIRLKYSDLEEMDRLLNLIQRA